MSTHARLKSALALASVGVMLFAAALICVGAQDSAPRTVSAAPSVTGGDQGQPVLAQAGTGGPNAIRFEHPLSLDTQLTLGALQDSLGFLWFTADDGLLRYDGHETVKYRPDPNSRSSDSVSPIAEGPDGAIWVGSTNGGIHRYDRTTNSFTHFTHDPNNPDSLASIGQGYGPQSLFVDRAGYVWTGSFSGLDRLDPRTGKFAHFRHDDANPDSLMSDNVSAIVEDASGQMWIGSTAGLDRLDPATGRFVHYRPDPQNTGGLDYAGSVFRILIDKQDPQVLWLSVRTSAREIYRFDTRTQVFSRYARDGSRGPALSVQLTALAEDNAGRLWMSWEPQDGLSIFDKKTLTFTDYRPDPGDAWSLSSKVVRGLLMDRAGTMWIIQDYSIDKVDPASHRFRLYEHDAANPQTVSDNHALAYYQDRAGIMWFGSWSGGLNRYDSRTGVFTAYRHDPADAGTLDTDFVSAILEDSSGSFWVGTGAGTLCRFERSTGKCVKHYRNDPEDHTSLPGNFLISAIVEDKDDPNVLWIGAVGAGLVRFDKRTEEFVDYAMEGQGPINAQVMGAFQDSDGILWLATNLGGLNRFDKKTAKFTAYTHDPSNPNSISSDDLVDVKGYDNTSLWIATRGGGLNRFDKNTGKFERFTQDNGLPTNSVVSIERDDSGSLWLGTDVGLVRFNPGTGETRTYGRLDGLQGDVFGVFTASWRSPDGQLWFGGVSGINSFYPSQIEDNRLKPKVVFTSITQGGTPLKDVKTAPEATTEIKLDWQSNDFEFGVAALNFTNPQKNRYQYKLDGFDKDWYDAGTKTTGRYSGLPDGTYTLMVRGSNNDGVWSDQVATLKVTVVAPFWRTTAFLVFMGLALLALLVGGFLWRIRAGSVQRRRLETLVAERTGELEAATRAAQAASEAKSRFLSSMSHELRSPLTSLLGQTERLLRRPSLPGDVRSALAVMLRSGDHLRTLINQVLDLSKVEAGATVLQEAPFDLKELASGLDDMFGYAASAKNIRLRIDIGEDVPHALEGDGLKLRQVLINLLGNAIKFTTEGEVALEVRRAPAEFVSTSGRSQLLFTVQDTGAGIAKDELPRLFGAFTQAEAGRQSREGTGLGLTICRSYVELMGGKLQIQSELGRGTTVTFGLPFALADVVPSSESEIPEPVALAPGQSSPRVLVVDDDSASRETFVQFLTSIGLTVREAANGKEGAELATESPDIIFMDVRMPVMDGIEATKLIRSRGGPQPIIVAMTASVYLEEAPDILAAGCDDFLSKPFHLGRLVAMMETHLGTRFLHGRPGEQPADSEVTAASRLDAALRERLASAIDLLEVEAIDNAIAQIRELDPALGESLAAYARDYRYGAILALMRPPSPVSA